MLSGCYHLMRAHSHAMWPGGPMLSANLERGVYVLGSLQVRGAAYEAWEQLSVRAIELRQLRYFWLLAKELQALPLN